MQYGREDVRMLMGIEVRDGNSGRLDFTDLCQGFRLDLLGIDPSRQRASCETRQSLGEARTTFSPAQQAGNL